jgi:hypothetical protein
MTCPTCHQPFPEKLEWNYVRQLDNGHWEASVAMSEWRGWAIQETEALARGKALERLHYAKDYLQPRQGV